MLASKQRPVTALIRPPSGVWISYIRSLMVWRLTVPRVVDQMLRGQHDSA